MFGKYTFVKFIGFSGAALFLCSCGEPNEKAPLQPAQLKSPENPPELIAPKKHPNTPLPLTTRYLLLAEQLFNTSCSSAEQLQTSTQKFLSAPSEKLLADAKKQWLTTHHSYAATLPFRNLNIKHPVLDISQTVPVKHTIAVRLDQTPLLPGYIDEISGYPKSGYVFSPLPIDRDTLNKEHQFADSSYVSLGFHVVEFLLWGEESRPHTDYLTPPTKQTQDANSEDAFKSRRSQLLSLTTTLLTEDISTLCKAWNNDSGFYSTTLKALPPEQQTSAINISIEQLISNIQIDMAKLRQSDEKGEGIEQHSEFSKSDEQDTQAQIATLKSIIESKEWSALRKKNEHTAKLTKLAKALLP